MTKTNIYAKTIESLLDADISLHYVSNITGHGLRKVMRARQEYTYVIEKLFKPQPIFSFIQNRAGLSDRDMYETYNMGNDYAIFLPEKDVAKAQKIISKCGFNSIHAGYIKKGPREVVITAKNLTFMGDTLDLRS